MASSDTTQAKQRQYLDWLLLLFCIFIAALAFLPGYGYKFPLYHFDDGWFLREFLARNQVAYEITLPGYPPGLFYLYEIIYRITDAFTASPLLESNPYLIIQNARFVNAIFNVVTTALIFLTARRLGNRWIAVAAALAWALMPYVSFMTLTAQAEASLALCFSLSLYCIVRALQDNKTVWASWAVVAGLVAVVFKYSAFPILGMGVGISLVQVFLQWQHQSERWRWLRALGIQFVLIVAVAFFLFFGYGAASILSRPEPSDFVNGGLQGLFNLEELLITLSAASTRIGVIFPIFLGIVLLGGYFFLRSASTWKRIAFVFAVGAWFVNQAFIVTYMVYDFGNIKYSIPATGLGVLVFALALYSLCEALAQAMKNKRFLPLLYLLALGFWLVPHAYDQYQMTLQRALPNNFMMLQDWVAQTISDSGAIYLDDLSYARVYGEQAAGDLPWLFDSVSTEQRIIHEWMILDLYGGYQGAAIPWLVSDGDLGAFSGRSVQEWRDLHVNYVTLDDVGLARLKDTESRIRPDELLLLRQFPPQGTDPNSYTGTSFSVYRIGQIQHETDLVLAETIHLVGFDLNTEAVQAGNMLSFTPYWRAETIPQKDYQVYLHLVPLASREVVSQADGTSSRPQRPMTSWQLPEEIIIGTNFSLPIPQDLPTGTYRLLLGLYDFETGQRLLADNGEDFLLIETFEIRGENQ